MSGVRRIDVEAACELLARPDLLVLDIREEADFEAAHIEGAELATNENLFTYMSETPKDQPILIYCDHGVSSITRARHFVNKGFAEVYSLDGGWEAWVAAHPEALLSPELKAFMDGHGFVSGDVNGRNKDYATPLMLAVRLAPAELVKELLDLGADIHAENQDGNQALWLACVGEIEENIRLLIEAGIDVQHVNANASTPLMFAASSGRAKAVKILLEAGADPNFETDLGLTAMDMASTEECLMLMRAEVRRRKHGSWSKPGL